MKQPVFFISNPSRKEKFALETKIWEGDDSLVSEKTAQSPLAVAHLNKMVASYDILSKLKDLSSLVSIVPAIKDGSSVKFNFISGNSAERVLLEAILNKDDMSSTEIIEKLISTINSLPAAQQDPAANSEYVSVFGNNYKGKTECSKIGLIDLNLDNFIIDEESDWHLIDYEWVFEFPVSRYFLIQRALWYFVLRHQEIFRYNCKKLDCAEIAKNTLVPGYIYKNYEKYFLRLNELLEAEKSFQLYVADKAYVSKLNLEFFDKPMPAQEVSLGVEKIVAQAKAAKELRRANNELKNQKDKLKRDKVRLERENQAIINSRSYRLATKMASAKRRLSSMYKSS